jgi:alpha-galactosidase/6-phospho-beta-glucosidase family protein
MSKIIFTSITVALILSGCGGGTETKSKTISDNSAKGNTAGKYNLWEYVVPSQSEKYSFIEKNGDKSRAYSTTYSKNNNIVTEISDYAQNEKTIYTKKSDSILVEFEKNGIYNGEYSLNLTSDIGDSVTIKESTCKLANHYNKIEISNINFTDVIEINCDGQPGYYQKNKGEIAYNGEANLRVRSAN